MFYNISEQSNIIMIKNYQNYEEQYFLEILRQNIFPDRPEEAACLAAKACQPKNLIQFCLRENLLN